jgi:hypothetical protein
LTAFPIHIFQDNMSLTAPVEMLDQITAFVCNGLEVRSARGGVARDHEKLAELIRLGKMVANQTKDNKDYYFISPEAANKELKCCFHPTGNHNLSHCLLMYVLNGIPFEFKRAVTVMSNSVREAKGGVAANQFRSVATNEFLKGVLHVDLRNLPELKIWAERSESENVEALRESIIDGFKDMVIPDIPGRPGVQSHDTEDYVHKFLVHAVMAIYDGGYLGRTQVSSLTGKLRVAGSADPVDYGPLEDVEADSLCNFLVYERRDGLLCPSGIPSTQAFLGATTLSAGDMK